jgi:hypothetical protein
LKVVYSRFSEKIGHIGLSQVRLNKEQYEKAITEKLKVGEEEFDIKKAEGTISDEFWASHGSHYQMCASRKIQMMSI